MSTFASTPRYSGTIPSSPSQKMKLPKNMLTALQAVRTSASTHLAGSLQKAHSNSPEKFYQDHVIAIFMGIYFETAMGPLLGALCIYLYSHWMM
jgi:endoglucanase Acf2